MITVKATREGLAGKRTASGYLVDSAVPFVALPSTAALRQWVVLRNLHNGRVCRALVLDVGPWNEEDHRYVFQPATTEPTSPADWVRNGAPPVSVGVRPQAESGRDMNGRVTNGAGIDLSEAVWSALGMTDNDVIAWEFV